MSEERFAFASPLEAEINSDGSAGVFFQMRGSDSEAIEALKEVMDQELGSEGIDMSIEDYKKRSAVFGFSSSRWNSLWEPQGPTKNWGPPPGNPQLN